MILNTCHSSDGFMIGRYKVRLPFYRTRSERLPKLVFQLLCLTNRTYSATPDCTIKHNGHY